MFLIFAGSTVTVLRSLSDTLKTICLFCKGKSFTHINFSMSGLVLPAIQTYAENIQALRRVSKAQLILFLVVPFLPGQGFR